MDRASVARISAPTTTEAELVEAIREDEAAQGRPLTPRESETFARGFFAEEYAAEIRRLAAQGLLDDEDDES